MKAVRVSRVDSEYIISEKLNIPTETVRKVLRGYVMYVQGKIRNGESTNILRICRLEVPEYSGEMETLAYVCTELADQLEVSKEVVKGILFYYEDCIVRDTRKYYSTVINGLLQLELVEYFEGRMKVRIRVSRALREGVDMHASVSRVFKRKVETG